MPEETRGDNTAATLQRKGLGKIPEAFPLHHDTMNLMGVRSVSLAPHEFFHVYNRGVDKRIIFQSRNDYKRFIGLLFVCNTNKSVSIRDIYRTHDSIYDFDREEPLVSIGAYCLMPNHFHILLTSKVDNGISTFMGKVSTAYAMYFNKKHDRTGSLFQGKFKAQHAAEDVYLKYLYAYIHLNPVKLIQPDWREIGVNDSSRAFSFCSTYGYSSLPVYLKGTDINLGLIDPTQFPEYFQTAHQHERELFDWLNYK